MKGELEKTLKLFDRSDFIFISYGSEIEGKYVPHSQALRLYPQLSLLEEAIEKTPQPNDFGIMPFEWRANSEEDKTHILLERKLSRWTEGELFAHGHLIIRRFLLDIDSGEKDFTKLKLEELKEVGIGKVGFTGGGLLAVIELDDEILVRDRQAFREIIRTVAQAVRKLIPDVDEQSFNAGKGVRLIGTFSRKRNVQTKWLLWEEGRKFDLCELVFGVPKEILSRAPEELRRKIEEKFSLKISGAVRKSSPEEVFMKASEFYGDLDGRRNDFMLKLSGEMYSEGIDREKVIELYYEHLAHLERKDSPRTRVKQTIEWVYKEGKKYRFSEGEFPRDFYTAVLGFRGKESPLSWREFAESAGPESFIRLLKKLGVKLYESESGVFSPEASLLSADIRCMWTEEDENS